MAIAFVQSTSNVAHSAGSVVKAFTSNNTSGNTLVCCIGVWRSGGGFSDPVVTDTKTNTWIKLLNTPLAGTSSSAYLFVAYNCAAGANTVTATIGGSNDIDMAIHEYSGCASIRARDQIAGGSNGTTTNILAGTLQTQFANEVVVSFAYDQTHGSQTFTPSAGWTAREQTNNPGVESLASYDQIASSTGSFTNTVTISSSNSQALHAIIASFADSSTTDDLVQATRANNPSTSSLGITYAAANTSGNLLLLAIGRWVSTTLGTITSVTDSQGNTWTLLGATILQSNSGQSQAHLYMCASCVAGSNTVTVATSSAQDLQLIAVEYAPHVLNTFLANSSGNPPTLGIASGSVVGDIGLLFSIVYNQSNGTGNYSDFSGTGWRNRLNQGDSSSTTLSIFDQLLTSATTIEQTISIQAFSRGLHIIVAVKLGLLNNLMEFLIT